jgi:predicted alpha/beta superfamily hydrolase
MPAPSDDGGAGGGDDGAIMNPQPGDDGGSPMPGSTTIRIHYPVGTHSLALRGNAGGLDWSKGIPLTGASNVFSYTFAEPAPARTEFKPLLDDTTWSHGANYVVTKGQTVDVFPHFVSTHGTVKMLFAPFHSTVLNNDRTIWVYTPASYDENTLASYPVLYMHDGQNLFDPSLAFGGNEWKVDETLDAGSEGDGSTSPAIREILVIGIENTAQRIYEYTPTTDPTTPGGGGGDLYLKMIVTELKPMVDAALRTLPARETTGIMGSSLGGLISAYAGVTHPDVFGIMGAMSPSTWWNNDWIVSEVKTMPPSPKRPARAYADCGDTNDDQADTTMLFADYATLGYVEGTDFMHVVQPGGQHNEVYWAQRLPAALAFLFGPR